MLTKTRVFLRDEVINIILTDKSCHEYVESIISKAIGINKDVISLELLTPRVNSNTNMKYSYVDAIYEDKDNSFIVNIEVNRNNTKSSRIKNMRYICHLLIKDILPSEVDKLNKKIYQININDYDILGKKEFLYESSIRDKKYHKLRDDYITIIDINMDILSKTPYNKIKEEEEDSLERLLYIFVCEDKENLNKLYLNNEIMEKVQNKMLDLTQEFMDGLYYNLDEFKDREAYELGTKDSKIEIAKAMLKDEIDIKIIMKYTNLSLKEIKKITKELI